MYYLFLIISIISAVIFNTNVKNRIKNGEEFDGSGYGLLCGILGAGLLPAAIAYSSVNTALEASGNSEDYKVRARLELKSFWKIYIACIICWVVINILIFINPADF